MKKYLFHLPFRKKTNINLLWKAQSSQYVKFVTSMPMDQTSWATQQTGKTKIHPQMDDKRKIAEADLYMHRSVTQQLKSVGITAEHTYWARCSQHLKKRYFRWQAEIYSPVSSDLLQRLSISCWLPHNGYSFYFVTSFIKLSSSQLFKNLWSNTEQYPQFLARLEGRREESVNKSYTGII